MLIQPIPELDQQRLISSKVSFIYFSLYSLLGCMLLVHYNPLLSDGLDFKILGFLKTFPLLLSAMLLISAFFSRKNNHKASHFQNQ